MAKKPKQPAIKAPLTKLGREKFLIIFFKKNRFSIWLSDDFIG